MKVDVSEETINIIETFSGKTIAEFLEQVRMDMIRQYEQGEKITIKKAAEIMGASQQFVRLAIQNGKLPFGVAVKTSTIYTYYISPKLFYEYTGYYIKKD